MTATHHRKRIIELILVMFVILLAFFMKTDPKSLPVILLIAPVAWLFVILSLSFYLGLNWSNIDLNKVSRKDIIYSLVGSGVISIALLLRSVNQLNGRDILLTTIFLVVASFYAKKLRFNIQSE